MVIDKYIFKEILKVQVTTTVVLLAIFIAQIMIRYVSRASVGRIPVNIVSQLVVYSVPDILFLMLPLTLFIGVLVALGRIATDSELVVMRASGYSTVRVMKIALVLAAVTAVLTGINNLYLMPWAKNARTLLVEKAERNPRYLPVESGRFVSFEQYNLYIDSVDDDDPDQKGMGNVYVLYNTFEPYGSAFTLSKSGHLQSDEMGVQWLKLQDANRYEPLHNGSYRVLHLDEAKMPVPISGDELTGESSVASMPTSALWDSEDNQAGIELQWRISPLFACFILTMVAVPLSLINPRQSKFTRLFPAIMLYTSYYLLLLSLNNLIRSNSLPVYPGLYLVPLVFGLLVVIPLNLPHKLVKPIKATKGRKTQD
ncbi:MAG: LPS export ABC transporter permease LptF [Succinivibrio sp.]|nr:LPS export ABC transporter permease LptF [Succinivibrio sp.]